MLIHSTHDVAIMSLRLVQCICMVHTTWRHLLLLLTIKLVVLSWIVLTVLTTSLHLTVPRLTICLILQFLLRVVELVVLIHLVVPIESILIIPHVAHISVVLVVHVRIHLGIIRSGITLFESIHIAVPELIHEALCI